MIKTRQLQLLALVLVLAIISACGSTSTVWPKATRAAPPDMPMYPSMIEGSRQTEKGKISFLTSDSREAIQGFYAQRLFEGGWLPTSSGQDPNYRSYSNRQACPIYTLVIRTIPQEPKVLAVDIRIGEEACADR